MPDLDLILDSGAYTAWSRGTPVDLDEYIAYIKANAEGIDHYVSLDVIPGEFGRVPTPAEVEASAQQGWDNLLYMQAQGLDPVPVFHQGERFYWLHRMIEHGCKYVGISPANDRTTGQKRLWLDRVFAEIVDDKGFPVIKTHAFGVTAIPLLIRYPWYSADSATWILMSGRGNIPVPRWKNGGLFYLAPPQIVFVSDRSQSSTTKTVWRDLSAERKHQAAEFLAEAGTTLDEVSESYTARARAWAHFFVRFGETKEDLPFKPVKTHLFKDS